MIKSHALLGLMLTLTFAQSAAAQTAKNAGDAYPTVHLPQAWVPEIRQMFYSTAQGSKIIPYDWAMTLMTAEGDKPFFSSENLKKYGYIPQSKSAMNADALPVGFTRDDKPAGFTKSELSGGNLPKYATMSQLGINCAACHTSELSYRGSKIRIDGGPSYSNFQMFTKEMDEAIGNVASENREGEKNFDAFKKFSERVAKRTSQQVTPQFLAQLRVQLGEFNMYRQQWQHNNGLAKAGIVYGPGRNDAFGAIFNQSLGVFLNKPENIRPANAPVKYPVIWDAPYHEIVQWVGIARNSQAAGGPIARNIGQVLGVFGETNVNSQSWTKGYCTSAKRAELTSLEQWVRTLRSPTWPKETFGFDAEKARRGQAHYAKYCISCHIMNERSPEEASAHMKALGITNFNVYRPLAGAEKKVGEIMVPIDGPKGVHTDALTAENAYSRTAVTGPLEGRKLKVVMGRPMESVEPAATVLRHVVAGSILGSFSYLTCANTPRDGQANLGLGEKIIKKVLGFTPEDTDFPDLQSRLAAFKEALSKYKARPLNGIWAAPPYLHNGSVRSLKELLTPSSQREREFNFSCNEFDPVNVGLDCSNVNADNRVTSSDFRFQSEGIRGNSNAGHDFGIELNEEQKMELIEYIKAL